ncbi:hypothetical protein GTP58_20810 [Duganella sp. CY15W]|uniref:hypothetical protein n=1 Tax=Duganella sp. CY15W TaxID=2692172 RepID=UPI00136DDEDF|nr:hypothetical protein [Duganella sp. CY15W]MYM30780.1 hypothetical protein [Duganella sp. CY15W]
MGNLKSIVLALALVGGTGSAMSAEALCSGKAIQPVAPSVAADGVVQLTGEQLVNAERILGEAKLKEVDPALMGMAAVPGQLHYLVRAAAFTKASNHFKGRILDHTLYISAHMLGHAREVEPAVLSLSSPVSVNAVECAHFATE